MASNIDRVDNSISKAFGELHASLNLAEKQIIQCFSDNDTEKERLSVKLATSFKEVESAKTYTENNIGDNELKSDILRDYDSMLAKLNIEKSDIERLMCTRVIWSDLGLEGLQSQLGAIRAVSTVEKPLPDLITPKCSGGGIGEELNWPNHIAIEEQTGEIYVSDIYHSVIQIFGSNAQYIRTFKHSLCRPRAILIRNSKLYVIENFVEDKIINFKVFSITDGSVLVSVEGVSGALRGQFGIASSFDLDKDEKWYITEPDNHRIQILKANLEHHGFFAPLITFASPIHLRIRDDSYVYVLDHPEKEIQPHYVKVLVLKIDGTWLKSVVLVGVSFSMYFAITECNYFVVTDFRNGCLKIFDSEGKLLLTGKKLSHPKGVEVLKDGRIVSMCMDKFPCLNIFC